MASASEAMSTDDGKRILENVKINYVKSFTRFMIMDDKETKYSIYLPNITIKHKFNQEELALWWCIDNGFKGDKDDALVKAVVDFSIDLDGWYPAEIIRKKDGVSLADEIRKLLEDDEKQTELAKTHGDFGKIYFDDEEEYAEYVNTAKTEFKNSIFKENVEYFTFLWQKKPEQVSGAEGLNVSAEVAVKAPSEINPPSPRKRRSTSPPESPPAKRPPDEYWVTDLTKDDDGSSPMDLHVGSSPQR